MMRSSGCDQCKTLRKRCDGHHPCCHCARRKIECTYARVPKKRGRPNPIPNQWQGKYMEFSLPSVSAGPGSAPARAEGNPTYGNNSGFFEGLECINVFNEYLNHPLVWDWKLETNSYVIDVWRTIYEEEKRFNFSDWDTMSFYLKYSIVFALGLYLTKTGDCQKFLDFIETFFKSFKDNVSKIPSNNVPEILESCILMQLNHYFNPQESLCQEFIELLFEHGSALKCITDPNIIGSYYLCFCVSHPSNSMEIYSTINKLPMLGLPSKVVLIGHIADIAIQSFVNEEHYFSIDQIRLLVSETDKLIKEHSVNWPQEHGFWLDRHMATLYAHQCILAACSSHLHEACYHLHKFCMVLNTLKKPGNMVVSQIPRLLKICLKLEYNGFFEELHVLYEHVKNTPLLQYKEIDLLMKQSYQKEGDPLSENTTAFKERQHVVNKPNTKVPTRPMPTHNFEAQEPPNPLPNIKAFANQPAQKEYETNTEYAGFGAFRPGAHPHPYPEEDNYIDDEAPYHPMYSKQIPYPDHPEMPGSHDEPEEFQSGPHSHFNGNPPSPNGLPYPSPGYYGSSPPHNYRPPSPGTSVGAQYGQYPPHHSKHDYSLSNDSEENYANFKRPRNLLSSILSSPVPNKPDMGYQNLPPQLSQSPHQQIPSQSPHHSPLPYQTQSPHPAPPPRQSSQTQPQGQPPYQTAFMKRKF